MTRIPMVSFLHPPYMIPVTHLLHGAAQEKQLPYAIESIVSS